MAIEFKTGRGIAGGIQAKGFFPNGYGYSIIQSDMSYGGDQGFYELAVLAGNESEWDLCYTTEITDDVIGWLTLEQAEEYVERIANL